MGGSCFESVLAAACGTVAAVAAVAAAVVLGEMVFVVVDDANSSVFVFLVGLVDQI